MEREFNSKVVPTSLNESIIKFLEKYEANLLDNFLAAILINSIHF